MRPSHAKQANDKLGRDVTHKSRTVTGYDDDDQANYNTTSSTVRARVMTVDEAMDTRDDLPFDEKGKVPQDAVVLRLDGSVSVDRDDFFEFDGNTYTIFDLHEVRAEAGKTTAIYVLVLPDR